MKKINELRDYLLENYVDRYGDLDISDLDFSEFNGDIIMSRMKVDGNLYQGYHKVKGNLYQSMHEVEGNLYQRAHDVEGNLYQSYHDVKGNYSSININVTGAITFEEPNKVLKEITVEELEKLGYKIKEEVK